MSFISDFKKFAMRGNLIDMAVGIIIGAAFGNIVSSLVADMIMPPIGLLLSGTDFSDLGLTIKHATENSPAVIINYGKFIQTIIDFVIIALSIFVLIKLISKMQKKTEETPQKPSEPTKEEILLTEIRDLLKEQVRE